MSKTKTEHRRSPCKGCGQAMVWGVVFKEDGSTIRLPLDPRAACYSVLLMPDGRTQAVREEGCMVGHHSTCSQVSRFTESGKRIQRQCEELLAALIAGGDVAELTRQLPFPPGEEWKTLTVRLGAGSAT
jgi:hypothetical protein